MKTKKIYAVLVLTGLIAIAAGTVSAASPAPSLADRWNTLRTEQPKLQIRDAARTLGTSEAELLATGIGKTVTRLSDADHAVNDIMIRALDLGTVLALTRNENGVLERTGVATKAKPESFTDKERFRAVAGGYLGGEIDMRFHFANWKHAFAVVQPGRDGATSRSLQFFDAQGNAAHKVYVKSEAGIAVFDKIVADFKHPQQTGELKVVAAAPKAAEMADSAVDVKEFQLAWKEMTDVHQFNRIVSEFKLTREQAMRLAPQGVVQKIGPQALRKLLDESAKQQMPIMAFLGNGAATQIYSGKVGKTAASGDWYNVLDPEFNLHIRESALKSGYVVQRAGVTSVEFFDQDGELVVTFFGVRERAKPQPQAWIDLTRSL
ncbi:putative hemin transport protein [Duganella sp. CF458]|uniref:hemin-degrading factor n=1 Tax=Duganella sp. CF458 TaxID=1884368 RepID=UPI0008DF78A2|nr:ChuX/HutX family heme-like substrate-binding protein [Duganella sp. CF458]SFG30683.1 putative hemin transport protein [Duganella sp. CF458]